MDFKILLLSALTLAGFVIFSASFYNIPVDKKKNKRILRIMLLVNSALSVLSGIGATFLIGHLYFSFDQSNSLEMYSSARIRLYLPWIIVLLVLFVLPMISSIVFHFLYHPEKEETVLPEGRTRLYLLLRSKDSKSLSAEQYDQLKKPIRKMQILTLGGVLLTLGLLVFPLLYLFRPGNFSSQGDLFQEFIRYLIHTVPFLVGIYVLWIVVTYFLNLEAKKVNLALAPLRAKPSQKAGKKKKIMILCIRGAILVTAITFIVVGVVNGEAFDVLGKAINICTECIGLG